MPSTMKENLETSSEECFNTSEENEPSPLSPTPSCSPMELDVVICVFPKDGNLSEEQTQELITQVSSWRSQHTGTLSLLTSSQTIDTWQGSPNGTKISRSQNGPESLWTALLTLAALWHFGQMQ